MRGDDPSDLRSRATTTTTEALAPGAQGGVTTTTAKGAPIQTEGAAPVAGAILSQAVDEPGPAIEVGEETDCAALDGTLTPIACTRVTGAGGHFLVYVGEHGDGSLETRLYREATPGSTRFSLFRRSRVFSPGGDVVGIALDEAEVGGEPVVIVDYDFNGSGAVHAYDVVAWDDPDPDPRVVAFINGSGGDHYNRDDDALQFVSANYEDGAPTCCPNFADIRTLRRAAPGDWDLTEETVPFAEAP